MTEDKLRRALRETRERNGWLIFYTHDVVETPSWDRLLVAIAARDVGGGASREDPEVEAFSDVSAGAATVSP